MDQQLNHKAQEIKQVERVGLYPFLVNLGLAAFKPCLAYLSGSLAILAASVDSATDSFASLPVWGGLRISARKSRMFPYGVYKIENVIQVIIAFFIFFAGTEIARQVISRRVDAPTIRPLVIVGMVFCVLIPLLFGLYTLVVGKRTGSPALIADGRHRQVDVLTSVVVLGAVVSNYLGLALDSVAAALVIIFIGYAGWELLVNGMRVLLDASLDPETLSHIREVNESEPAVIEIQSLVGRSSGRYRFLEAELALRTDDLVKTHSISQRIENNIHENVPHVDRVLIHYEPRKMERVVVAVPIESDRQTLSEHFGEKLHSLT